MEVNWKYDIPRKTSLQVDCKVVPGSKAKIGKEMKKREKIL